MTLPKGSLHPASSNDRRALLSALEFVACVRVQFAQIVGTVVGQRVSFEPRPQIFDGVDVRCVRRQERDLDMPVQSVQILSHETAAMCPQTIPDDQQRLLQVGFERLEETDDFLLLDAALVQPEQTIGARESGNDRDVIPVEVELDDGGLPLGRPCAHPCWAFADAGLVHKDDQAAFSLGFF